MFRLTAGMVVMFEGRVLAGRSHMGYWGMPQGGIEVGETAVEAATRELQEETGLNIKHWDAETEWYMLELPTFVRRGRYKYFFAQKYKWFFIHLNQMPVIKLCPKEYSEAQWVIPENMIRMASFKADMYKWVFTAFGIS